MSLLTYGLGNNSDTSSIVLNSFGAGIPSAFTAIVDDVVELAADSLNVSTNDITINELVFESIQLATDAITITTEPITLSELIFESLDITPASINITPNDLIIDELVFEQISITPAAINVISNDIILSDIMLDQILVDTVDFSITLNDINLIDTLSDSIEVDATSITTTLHDINLTELLYTTIQVNPAIAVINLNDISVNGITDIVLDTATLSITEHEFNILEANALVIEPAQINITTNDLTLDADIIEYLETLAATIDVHNLSVLEQVELNKIVNEIATYSLQLIESIQLTPAHIVSTTNKIFALGDGDNLIEGFDLSIVGNLVDVINFTELQVANESNYIITHDVTIKELAHVEIHEHEFFEPTGFTIRQRKL